MTSKSTTKFRQSQLDQLTDPQVAPLRQAMEVALSDIDALTRDELGLLNYLIHAEVKGILNDIIDAAVENKAPNIAHAALADTLSSLGTYVATIISGETLDTCEEVENAVALAKVNLTFRRIQEVTQASLSASLPPETIEQAKALRAAVDRRVEAGEDPQEALKAAIESGEVQVPQGVRDHLLGVPAASADDDSDLHTGQYL